MTLRFRLQRQLRYWRTQRQLLISGGLIVGGLIGALLMAVLAWREGARQEPVMVVLREITVGAPLAAEDFELVMLPRHRPVQLRGISDQRAVVGRYAARELRPGDLLQPSMLRDDAPSQPRYPNGALLTRGMVPFAVALRGLGPLSVHDRLNLGFSDSGGGAQLCSAAPDTAAVPYACRLLSSLRILYIDEAAGLLYVEVTPYQAQSLYALQAAGVVLWAERYAADAPQLSELSRLESRAIERSRLQAPAAP